jgi:hypothetical protein
MAEDETINAIDAETKAALEEQVKKGKARKFVLICKGASIENLTVFKKGPYATRITQAKKAGFRGIAYCGVITGKGVNIDLQLPGNAAVSQAMGTEGNAYDDEPCKVAKLREFLAEAGDLKFKPTFSIITSVAQVVAVSESDDEEADEAPAGEAPASEAPAAAAAPRVPTQDLAALKRKLTDSMKQLLPRMKQAITDHPDRKDELFAIANKFNSHLKNDELDAAKVLLLSYAKLLQQLAGAAGPAADGAGDWDARVARLTPRMKQVLGQKLGDFAQAAALFKQAREAQASNPQAAQELLTKCEQLVDEALGSGQAAAGRADDDGFMKAWADVEKDWLEAVETADGQIAQLQAALRKSGDDELGEIAEFGLPAVTGNFKVPLMAAMRDLSGGQAAARQKSIEKLRGLTEQFNKHLNSDARVAAVDENDFGVRVTLRETLGGALEKMHAVLSRS